MTDAGRDSLLLPREHVALTADIHNRCKNAGKGTERYVCKIGWQPKIKDFYNKMLFKRLTFEN